MNKEKIINTLESDNELSRAGIHYPLTQKNVGDNIILYLESTYLYLVETDGHITEESYKDYLQKIIILYYYGDVKDFHKANCYQLIKDKQEGIPWHLCSLMKFDTMEEENLTMMVIQRIVYSNVLNDVIACIKNN